MGANSQLYGSCFSQLCAQEEANSAGSPVFQPQVRGTDQAFVCAELPFVWQRPVISMTAPSLLYEMRFICMEELSHLYARSIWKRL